ncbi:hypothetical protein BX070DRAFT_220392 [Coemansia spiralis]|nr:hypothetical protein BX070DRAFT_220392 [Coemansia spiralis]
MHLLHNTILLAATIFYVVIIASIVSSHSACNVAMYGQQNICDAASDVAYLSKTVLEYNEYIQYRTVTKMVFRTELPQNTAATTVTQIIYISGSHSLSVPLYATAAVDPADFDSKKSSSLVNEKQTPHQIQSTWRDIFAVKPFLITKAIVAALFSYAFVPTWHVGLWIMRVLIYRPAAFTYILFLERPFQATISLFLWVLPLLSFIIATTVVGTIIGGTFGWISAVAVNVLRFASTNDNSALQTDSMRLDLPRPEGVHKTSTFRNAPTRENNTHKHTLVLQPEAAANLSLGRDSLPPGKWTRRRRLNRSER